MTSAGNQFIAAVIVTGSSVLLPVHSLAVDSDEVRTHAEQSFDRLTQHKGPTDSSNRPPSMRHTVDDRTSYSSEHYLLGKGQGDLSKGKIVCQRVSELSARTDLAKQIRILVKEHMIDRVRERTGRETEQDIELTREEIVQEYLQGVTIVDRRIDEEGKTCSATAVMPKSQIQPKPAPHGLDSAPAVVR